mgnify:CR=1 FL=1
MVFSSLKFLFLFLPVFFLIYAVVPNIKWKNFVIFIGSLLFYSFGVWDYKIYIPLFFQTIVVNYIVGQWIYESGKNKKTLRTLRKPKGKKKNFAKAIQLSPKFWLLSGILYNLWWLFFFKYAGFFWDNSNRLFHTDFPENHIVLPIGISFYTFQNLSYLVDVYWKRTKPAKSFIDYGAYISMFPQLIAGPVVTYTTVAEQLKTRKHSLKQIDEGLRIFTAGLGCKVLIANQIGGLWSDITTVGFRSISTPLAWMGILAYTFQIYFDFYGYSLMAVGLGKMMAFELPQNFNDPYQSLTMTEFWRRWHITLGSWFREYVYIPMGGNRHGTAKTIRNMFMVWFLTGFWHGASWNFIFWGIFLFVVMLTEKLWTGQYWNQHKFLGHCYMILLIPLSWTLFAITDMDALKTFFTRLFPFIPHEVGRMMEGDYLQSAKVYWKYFVAAIVFCTPFPKRIIQYLQKYQLPYQILSSLACLVIFWSCVYCMYKGLNDPFLYFRF